MGGSRKPALERTLTRAEQEVRWAAERLSSRIADALAAVAARQSPGGLDELEASPDRLEWAARDLAVALRELVEERRENHEAALKTAVQGGQSRRHFGAWDSGDVRSADNERIDHDLAGEYGKSH